MFEGKTVGVVVPCYDEEKQIQQVLDTLPDFVDCVIVVDDASADGTRDIVRRCIQARGQGERFVLIEHDRNRGVGAAIVTGYQEALRRELEVTAVMAGDGQMAPDELHLIVGPVARDQTDYAKGNRIFYHGAWNAVPKHRYLGNAFLSMLTKIASGYWHVADSQTGYTAISLKALQTIELDGLYPRYGYPNDLLVRLNVYNMRVADVPIRPVYNVGEQSKMKLWKVIPAMSWLIFKRFWWRMKEKYIIHDFHPLILFYLSATLIGLLSTLFFLRLIWVWATTGRIPQMNALAWGVCLISSIQFALFAMWFDMEMNRNLAVKVAIRSAEREKQAAGTAPSSRPEPESEVRVPAGNPSGEDRWPA